MLYSLPYRLHWTYRTKVIISSMMIWKLQWKLYPYFVHSMWKMIFYARYINVYTMHCTTGVMETTYYKRLVQLSAQATILKCLNEHKQLKKILFLTQMVILEYSTIPRNTGMGWWNNNYGQAQDTNNYSMLHPSPIYDPSPIGLCYILGVKNFL